MESNHANLLRCRVLLAGDSDVGKTSLISAFLGEDIKEVSVVLLTHIAGISFNGKPYNVYFRIEKEIIQNQILRPQQ